MLVRRLVPVVAGLGALLLGIAPAWSHGILHHADPAPGSTVGRVPSRVSVLLTEAPVPDGKFVVRDGCGRIVNDGFEVDGADIAAAVSDAEPGSWRVRFDFISKVDGHRYADAYSFRVTGKKDCSKPQGEAGDDDLAAGGDGNEAELEAGGGNGVPDGRAAPASEEGGFPIVPVALGSVALVGVALLARRSARG